MANLNEFLWLTTRPGFRPGEIRELLRRFGTPEAVYFAPEEEYRLAGLPEVRREALRDKSLDRAEKIQEDCDRLGIRILTIQDAHYPERLAQIDDAPCVLYLKGKSLQVDDRLTVGLVGTRTCTPYGVDIAGRLGLELARSGVVLVSGMAKGIDAAGIRGALSGGGTVISVLGGGIDMPFPPENRLLQEDVGTVGTLVSEYPPGTLNYGRHFPVRNRIISGLSMGVAVVEAGIGSGALITARQALEQNREVFAVPGPTNAPASMGTNRLIQRGEAKLIITAGDILDEFALLFPEHVHPRPPLEDDDAGERLRGTAPVRESGGPRKKAGEKTREEKGPKAVDKEPERAYISLSDTPERFTDDQRDVLLALMARDMTADEIAETAQFPARRVLSALTLLQLEGVVEEKPGKRFSARVILTH
ncbi:MAG: DNA-processing protein DprA [Clostridiales bacterium]|nr:DNA-processing protein DprA [Clostridiales bacterium]